MNTKYTKVLFETLCRCCKLETTPESQVLLQSYHFELLNKITSIELTVPDKLPKVLCQDCDSQLKTTGEFVLNCEKTHFDLLGLVDQIGDDLGVKEESKDGVAVKQSTDDEYECGDDTTNESLPLFVKIEEDDLKPSTQKREKRKLNKAAKEEIDNFEEKCETSETIESCKICGKSFAKKSSLRIHELRKHSPNREEKCEICGRKMSAYRLVSHLASHGRGKKCKVCGKEFPNYDRMNQHMKTHSNERPYKCHLPDCDKTYKRQNHLNFHIAHVHQGTPYKKQKPYVYKKGMKPKYEGEFPCTQCGIVLKTKYRLEYHMQSHEGGRFLCPECGNAYTSNTILQNHIRSVHTKERPFLCSGCPKSFASSYNLRMHIKIHTGVKPYPCPQCEMRFIHKRAMISHQRVHTGEKKYTCSVCQKKFAWNVGLTIHMRIHTGEITCTCPYCKKGFRASSNMYKHIRRHHPNEALKLPEQKNEELAPSDANIAEEYCLDSLV